jgi:ribose/xylose/arabinose/galactoside ABC-type transport system permease subunit
VSIIGIVTMGMSFVILTGGIDLSVGPIVACSALLVAGLKDFGPFVAFFAAIIFGLFAGLLNGTIITKFKVQPFIVTLGMMSILTGLGLTYSKGHPIIGTPEALSFFGQGKIGIIPAQAVLFAIIAIACGLILNYTRLGRYTYAIGGNEEASRLSGLSVGRIKTMIYGISGLLCGFAGVMMATHLNVGEANLGTGMEMDAIAAAVIGGTSLQGGKGTVVGSVIGVLIIGVLSNLLNLLNVPGYSQSIFKGVIIVGAALLQSLQEKR